MSVGGSVSNRALEAIAELAISDAVGNLLKVVREAYEECGAPREGRNSQVVPIEKLATMPPEEFDRWDHEGRHLAKRIAVAIVAVERTRRILTDPELSVARSTELL